MTKEEMIEYYANEIIEDAIKELWCFNIIIDANKYKDISSFKEEVSKKISEDKRISDVKIDKDGNFDIVFYTEFCVNYVEEELE